MARELLIFRHGKSDWTTAAPTDFHRPLARSGRKAVKRMGRWLKEQKLLPDHIVSSPAKRARQTAERLCRSADLPKDSIHWEGNIYEADVEALLGVLAACPGSAQRVMLIGHNPGLEELVQYLSGGVGEPPPDSTFLPTAALVQLKTPNTWKNLGAGGAKLLSITRPRELETTE